MTTFYRRSAPIRRDAITHLFAVGQSVRLRAGFAMARSMPAEIYHVTATLPARGDSLQYRIRSDAERYERVTTQDSLELVHMSPAADDTTLIERTFDHGQGAETQQP